MQVSVNGIQSNYEWSGRKGGEIVLLSHAVGSSLVMWEPQVAALEPSFGVLRYDMRGHGGTPASPAPYTMQGLGEDVLGLLNALGLSKVHFVGLSIGGMIGQYLGVAHPERLHSLTLSNTFSAPSRETQATIQGRIDLARSKGMGAVVESTMQRWFTAPLLDKNPPIIQKIRQQILATTVEGYVGCFQAIQQFNYTDRLPDLGVRTLIMTGDQDPGTPVSSSQDLKARISGSQLIIIPGARHVPNIEQADRYNQSLVRFLAGLSRDPSSR